MHIVISLQHMGYNYGTFRNKRLHIENVTRQLPYILKKSMTIFFGLGENLADMMTTCRHEN